jgi:hypothetical protein
MQCRAKSRNTEANELAARGMSVACSPTLQRGAICCRRIRGESHRVVAGLLTEPLVPIGTVSIVGCSRLATGGLRE